MNSYTQNVLLLDVWIILWTDEPIRHNLVLFLLLYKATCLHAMRGRISNVFYKYLFVA